MKSPLNEIFKSLDSLQEELNEQNKVNIKKKNLEKVKQFLLEKELLLEKDNREIIVKKLGLPQEVADFAHEISDKYSLWIAKEIKSLLVKKPESAGNLSDYLEELNRYGFTQRNNPFARYGLTIIHAIEMFKDDNRPPLDIKNLNLNDAENYYNIYRYIKDWRDNPDTPTLNLRNMTWNEAENLSREWHESLQAGGKVSYILDEKDEIIHEFSDGFYWVLRESNTCSKSQESMGHCAKASNSDMYLFRLIKNDEEFITADYDPTDKYIIQIKGKKNSKPKMGYYPYIMWLIAESNYIDKLRTDEGYNPQNNFHLSNLDNEQLKYVLLHNPKIIFDNKIKGRMFNYNLLDLSKFNFIKKDKDLFNKYNIIVKQTYKEDKDIDNDGFNFLTDNEINKILLNPKTKEDILSRFVDRGINDNDVFKNIKKLFDLGLDEKKIFNSFRLYSFEKPENIFKLFKGKTLKNYLIHFINNRYQTEVSSLFLFSERPINLLNFFIKNIGEEKAYELIDGIFDENDTYGLFTHSKNIEEIRQIKKIISDRKNSNPTTPLNEIFKSLTSLQEELNEQNKENIKKKNLEKVKQFLLEKELLLEKDNRQFIVDKLGLSQEIADYAHNMSDKYSLWIANQIKDDIDNYNSTFNRFKLVKEHMLPNIISMFKDDNIPNIDIKNLNFSDAEQLYNLYGYVKDWRDNPNVPSINLRNMSWDEAENLSREWHESLGKGGRVSNILDEKDKIIHKFSNGFYWVLREDSFCEKSKDSMGHCAKASSSDMYLFRLIKNDEEFITADWNPTKRNIIQLKGKANTKPKEIYYPYIIWLIADSGYIDELRTNKGYIPETNFHLEDLNEKELKYVISKNPNLINILDILSMSEDKIKNIINILGDDLNKLVIKLATEKFDDLYTALIIKNSDDSKNLISLLFKFFGKTFINNLNRQNLTTLFYKVVNLEGVASEDEDKVKDKLIDYILEIGGEELYYRLTTKEFVNKITTGFMYTKSKTKGVNKFILNLLKINGKEMLMNIDENEIQHFFVYIKKTSLIKFIRLFIKIGGEDFLNKQAKNENFFKSLWVYTYRIQNKDEIINDMIMVGGKNFLMNLNEKNITTILSLIRNTTNSDELINKIINIGGEDFIKSLSVNNVNDFINYSSYENKNEIKSLFQKYGKYSDTPMNEIFKSLTSLQEELNEQRKLTIKESNLMKVQNFFKNRKNNQ